jgi:hypothetical protein
MIIVSMFTHLQTVNATVLEDDLEKYEELKKRCALIDVYLNWMRPSQGSSVDQLHMPYDRIG